MLRALSLTLCVKEVVGVEVAQGSTESEALGVSLALEEALGS